MSDRGINEEGNNSPCIRRRYSTLQRGKVSERRFDPHAVYFDPDGATLKATGDGHERSGISPFLMDHIERLSKTSKTFPRPSGFTPQPFLTKHSFNGIRGKPLTAQLHAHGATAHVFAKRRLHQLAVPVRCAL